MTTGFSRECLKVLTSSHKIQLMKWWSIMIQVLVPTLPHNDLWDSLHSHSNTATATSHLLLAPSEPADNINPGILMQVHCLMMLLDFNQAVPNNIHSVPAKGNTRGILRACREMQQQKTRQNQQKLSYTKVVGSTSWLGINLQTMDCRTGLTARNSQNKAGWWVVQQQLLLSKMTKSKVNT